MSHVICSSEALKTNSAIIIYIINYSYNLLLIQIVEWGA